VYAPNAPCDKDLDASACCQQHGAAHSGGTIKATAHHQGHVAPRHLAHRQALARNVLQLLTIKACVLGGGGV